MSEEYNYGPLEHELAGGTFADNDDYYCQRCSATLTEADASANKCTQCGEEIRP